MKCKNPLIRIFYPLDSGWSGMLKRIFNTSIYHTQSASLGVTASIRLHITWLRLRLIGPRLNIERIVYSIGLTPLDDPWFHKMDITEPMANQAIDRFCLKHKIT